MGEQMLPNAAQGTPGKVCSVSHRSDSRPSLAGRATPAEHHASRTPHAPRAFGHHTCTHASSRFASHIRASHTSTRPSRLARYLASHISYHASYPRTTHRRMRHTSRTTHRTSLGSRITPIVHRTRITRTHTPHISRDIYTHASHSITHRTSIGAASLAATHHHHVAHSRIDT